MHGAVVEGGKSINVPDTATAVVDGLLSAGIKGFGSFKGAIAVAEEHRQRATDDEAAIASLIDTHMRRAAVSGFVTGLGGFVAMPITLPASVVGLAVIATRMTAGIAHLRGYDINSEQVQSVVFVSLLGSAGADLLKKAGIKVGKDVMVRAGGKAGPVAGFAALRVMKRAAGRQLVSRFAPKGVAALPKAIPVAGGVLGAGIDGMACRSIAKYAKKNFPRQPAPR